MTRVNEPYHGHEGSSITRESVQEFLDTFEAEHDDDQLDAQHYFMEEGPDFIWKLYNELERLRSLLNKQVY